MWDAGSTKDAAKRNFVVTAKSFGLSGNMSDYLFKNIGTRCDNPEIGDVLPEHLRRR